VTETRERGRKKLLDGLEETAGYRELKEEVLDRLRGELAFEEAMDLYE
jgi:hypothetical protein